MDLRLFAQLLCGVGLCYGQETLSSVTCPNKHFTPVCNRSSQVLLMQTALYGRMQPGLCVEVTESGVLGCSADVRLYIDEQCSGRTSCSVDVDDLTTYVNQVEWPTACSTDLRAYLEATYSCLQVFQSDIGSCALYNETVLPEPSGFVASLTLAQGLYGTQQCPWAVSALPGQRLRLVVYDFSSRTLTSDTSAGGCGVDIILIDGGEAHTRNICGGSARERYLYTSTNNHMKFYVNNRGTAQELGYFLLQYQPVGCAHFNLPPDSHVIYTSTTAYVICNNTDLEWELSCMDNEWTGSLGNCTPVAIGGSTDRDTGAAEFPWGIVVAVVIGIAIGVVVGLALLGVVFLCRRCFCPSPPRRPPPQPLQQQPHMHPKDVPPMEELINAATIMAKQGPMGRDYYYRRQASMPRHGHYPRPGGSSDHDYQQGHPLATLRPHPGRAQSEEHIYERYNAISRNSSGEFAEIIEPLPEPPPHRYPLPPPPPPEDLMPSTSAHPLDGADTLSTQASSNPTM